LACIDLNGKFDFHLSASGEKIWVVFFADHLTRNLFQNKKKNTFNELDASQINIDS